MRKLSKGFILILILSSFGFTRSTFEEFLIPLEGNPPPTQNPLVVRSRLAQTRNFVPLGSDPRQGAPGLVLNLFPDVNLIAVRDRIEWRGENRFTWFGKIAGAHYHSNVILTFENGAFGGDISVDRQQFSISQIEGNVHVVSELDTQTMLEDEVLYPPKSSQKSLQDISVNAVPPDDGSKIDVMIIYTESAGEGNILNSIQLMIDQTNQAFARSGVTTRFRLVRAYKTGYREVGGSLGTDLTRLQGNGDGHMDEVHQERVKFGADIVTLVVNANIAGVAGIGYLNGPTDTGTYAFSVVQLPYATSRYTYSHEVGHNMGCHHDRPNASGSGAYSYSYGYYDGTAGFGTIMAYPGTRILNFSNPNVSVSGQPTGIADPSASSAENWKSINNMAPFVARYATSTVSDSQTVEKVGLGCFVATATFGSPLASEVFLLRKFRDEKLAPHKWGQALINFYYSLSPPLAQFIEDHPSVRPLARAALSPIIHWVKSP